MKAGSGLCLFGGAFNPPHRTHERILRACLDQLPVRECVVLPSGRHPFKGDLDLAPAAARVELCRLAFDGMPGVRVSDWEASRPGTTYTVETLRHFAAADPGRALWFVIGSDNLPLLPEWKEIDEVLRLATIVTLPRAGHAAEPAIDALALPEGERRRLREHLLRIEPDDVSASRIRARLAAGEDCSALLHPRVLARIRELLLYGAR
jgi:nicotinate-nucleotide adenylyltransferase